MKGIKTNRFLVWLMWAIPIACTGFFGIIIWAVVQMCLCKKEMNAEKERNTPAWLKPNIVEMNTNKNLTTEEKLFIYRHLGYYYKIGIDKNGHTRYQYDDLKKFWKNVSYSKTAIDVWSQEWGLLHEQDYLKKNGKPLKYGAGNERGWKNIYG